MGYWAEVQLGVGELGVNLPPPHGEGGRHHDTLANGDRHNAGVVGSAID